MSKFLRLIGCYVVFPLALLVATLGGTLLIVASPPVWAVLYEAPAKVSDFAQEDGELIAYHLWTDTPYAEVSRELKGWRLVEREIVHYEDLQEKFRQLLWLVGCAAVVGLLGVLLMRHRKRIVLTSLVWLALIASVGGVWSLINWRGMFRSLHWWIFQDDSWILPWGCYSLRLYPYSVWKSAMVWMVVMSVLIYVLLYLLAKVLDKKLTLVR